MSPASALLRAGVAASALALAGCAGSGAPSAYDLPPAEGFIVQPLGIDEAAEPGAALAARLSAGLNLQFLVAGPVDSLVDPAAVSAEHDGAPWPALPYLVSPGRTLLFVAPPQGVGVGGGDLRLAIGVLDRGEAARASFDLPAWNSEAAFRAGPAIRVVDADGDPVAGAAVFGQTRSDLFGLVDGDGAIVLDRPDRHTPSDHWAMADGFWSEPFSPLESRRIVLRPRSDSGPEATAVVVDGRTGEPIPGALLHIQRTDWARTGADGSARIELPPHAAAAEVLAAAPGLRPRSVLLAAGDAPVEIALLP